MKKLSILIAVPLLLYAFSSANPNAMHSKKPYTILVLLNASPQWLSLNRDERSQFVEEDLNPIFRKVSPAVEIRLFDSEYFHAEVSDFMIITCNDLDQHKLFIEMLRDSKIYSVPYFEVKDIIVGQENLFEDFNAHFKKDQE
ncbi:darcynin family protein [Croceimicrobium sp.]|uniref:darcynin family protein n=1 Tax=Croceimicrobium sp. TaxID=2828340 RepID=UPI003BADB2C4